MSQPQTRRYDLSAFTPEDLARALSNAVMLGAADAENQRDEKKGREVLTALNLVNTRRAHARFFQTAYMAGRFQVQTAHLDD